MSDEKGTWEGGIGGRHRGRGCRREGKSAGLCALVWHLAPAGIQATPISELMSVQGKGIAQQKEKVGLLYHLHPSLVLPADDITSKRIETSEEGDVDHQTSVKFCNWATIVLH